MDKKKKIPKDSSPKFSHDDLAYSLNFYQKIFSSTDPELLIELSKNYEALLTNMQSSLKYSNNQICILYGLPGFGRKSCIDFCLNSLQKKQEFTLKKIYIDASFHNNENTFIKNFMQQLYNKKYLKFGENSLDFKNLFNDFKEKEDEMENVVLVIDKVEELVSVKKQTILYGLLEWIRNENHRVFVVFITNNLLFLDLLEKRVKSRLSLTTFYFFSYTFESIMNVIQTRVNKNDRPIINKYLMEILHLSPLIDILKTFHLQNKPISFYLSFLQTLFCCMDDEDFKDEDDLAGAFKKIMISAASQAKNLLIPQIDIILNSSLTSPQLLLLVAIKKFIENKFEATLHFENVLSHIENFNKQTNSSSLNKITFSKNVFTQAFEELINIGFLKLSGLGHVLDFSKAVWMNSEIILNIPLEELINHVNAKVKGKEMPMYFYEFCDFKI